MPVTGLVIVLDGRSGEGPASLESIRGNERFTVGTGPAGPRVPVVLETSSDGESRRQIDWLKELPGVAMVEVAYVHFADVAGGNADKEHTGHGC